MDRAPSLPTAANAAVNRAAPPTADKRSALYHLIAFFLEGGIQVSITGKRIREADAPWLRCPLSERGRCARIPSIQRSFVSSSSRVTLVSAS